MSVMVSGFLCVGSAKTIVDKIAESNIKDIILIVNDTGTPTLGCGKWVVNKQVKKVIATHIGLNSETGRQMNEGELDVELVPQGTFAERIRIGGAGIGGFYTPTGVGTEVEIGKEKKNINGKDYILEKPLRAEVALINGAIVDKNGNVYYDATARNFNPLMAMAADIVICEAEKIVEVGEIDPNMVITPGILVDYIVQGGK
ncbi:MAG: CoA transferase subunit A [Bacilli bacterium]|nr:CoA transferase subunit A [Bacilli bacterium]